SPPRSRRSAMDTAPPSFSPCCRAHPDLHSFPTRRSSDLSTSQPPSLNGKLRRQESQQSAASSSYAVRAIEESVSGTVSGRILYRDRKSTRLNSSHVAISYAVFCLKKKITNAT